MNKSESIANLALALSKLQGEVSNVHKDKQGYGYKYTDLSSILDLTRPLCAKYELAVTQLCGESEAGVSIETVLLHSSGEWLSGTLTLPITIGKGMTQAQAIGSCISYGRRYSIASLLGIAQTDNDAALCNNPAQDQLTSNLNSVLADKKKSLTQLEGLIKEHDLADKVEGWLKHFEVKSLDALNVNDMQKLIKNIQEKV
jgi:hypothetical protein